MLNSAYSLSCASLLPPPLRQQAAATNTYSSLFSISNNVVSISLLRFCATRRNPFSSNFKKFIDLIELMFDVYLKQHEPSMDSTDQHSHGLLFDCSRQQDSNLSLYHHFILKLPVYKESFQHWILP